MIRGESTIGTVKVIAGLVLSVAGAFWTLCAIQEHFGLFDIGWTVTHLSMAAVCFWGAWRLFR